MVWLRDKYKQGFVDLEGILIELIKREIIKEASVKGMPSELIFLTNDILMLRVPPVQLLEDPSDKGLPSTLVEDYRTEVKKFFQNYRPSEQDNLRMIDTIINPQVYETLRLLRTAIVTRNDLEKLKKKGVEDIDDVLKTLWDAQMLIFPKYLLRVIKEEYDKKSKADQVLIEYLDVLESTYLNVKAAKKASP
ncbi:MAG: hypothetical protein ACTSPH_10620 [Promethearchaeota archaeon]